MKLTFLFMTIFIVQSSASVFSQKVNLFVKEANLEHVLKEVRRQSGYAFLYDKTFIKKAKPITVELKNADIAVALQKIFNRQPFTFEILENTIVVKNAEPPVVVRDSLLSIKGRVFDTKEPPQSIPGVSVKVKGGTAYSITDENGNFSIRARKGDILEFNYVGFKPSQYVINSIRDNLVIALQGDVAALDEVRITGFSEQKLKHLANSTSTVNIRSSIEGKPITQLSQALQGGATGITVSQGSGLPGGDAAIIKIRGISTIGDTQPLVLVDGVPYNIDDVDPTTVESINVLKDAAAASIYGSRAANGVIVITTIRGVPGKVVVSYDSYAGLQKPQYLPQFVDAPTYMEMVNQAKVNTGGAGTYSADVIEKTRTGVDPLLYPNSDWKGLILKNQAATQSHTVGIKGGNNLARFAVTGSYLDQKGIVGSAAFKRYALRANTSVTLGDNISMYLDLNVLRKDQTQNVNYFSQDFGGPSGGSAGGGSAYILNLIYSMPPNIVARYPVKENGYQAYANFGEMRNPLANIERGGDRRVWSDDMNVNLQPQWNITRHLKLKGQYLLRLETDANRIDRDAYTFLDYYTNVVQFTFADNKANATSRSLYSYSSAILDFNQTFGKHTIYALGGTVREQEKPDNFQIRNLASYFVKLNYVFDDKYLFESTWRTDGSSLFAEGNKWGAFPSVAAGWNVHSEKFMGNLKFIDKLKARASYGLLGNNRNVAPYRYQSTISASNGVVTVIGNPDITWETVTMLDLGVDIGLFKNKLGVTVDWFDKITDDILLSPPLSLSSGVRSIPVNSGKVRNRGWEFMVNYATQFAKDLRLSFNAGYSYYTNEVLTLKNGPYINPDNISGSESIHQVGYPIGSYYGYRTNGLLQESDIAAGVPRFGSGGSGSLQVAGDIKYIDTNKDGNIDSQDKVVLGNPEPQGNYFLNARIEVKNFDLEAQINGFTESIGLYSGRYRIALDGAAGVPMTYQTDYWTPANTDAILPRLTTTPGNNALMSDYWLTNAAFARVRFVQLGYNFKNQWLNKVRLSGLRLYFNAQNSFTITKMKYLDPESRGSETVYPLMKTYTFGLSVKF